MELTFNQAQQQVDDRIKQHPDGYRSNKKIFKKMEEELKEIKDAFEEYQKSPTDENLKKLKTEVGDILFAIICFTNKNSLSKEECVNLMMEKNNIRAENDYKK